MGAGGGFLWSEAFFRLLLAATTSMPRNNVCAEAMMPLSFWILDVPYNDVVFDCVCRILLAADADNWL